MSRMIKSDALIEWFRECGLPMSPEHRVSRIVIDAQADHAVKVYVEMFGTTEMLNVKPPEFAPAQITIVGDEEDAKI